MATLLDELAAIAAESAAPAMKPKTALRCSEKIKLLEVLQMDPNLQALVKAGLFKWDEIMKDNDGSVVSPDGSKPPKIIDESKLKDLQSKLLESAARATRTGGSLTLRHDRCAAGAPGQRN